MTVTFVNLIASKYCENTQVTQYTSISGKAIIDKFTASNTTSSYATIKVNIVIGGGSAATSNLIVPLANIAPYQTYYMPELVGHVLEKNMFISTIASTSNAIVIRASGREIT